MIITLKNNCNYYRQTLEEEEKEIRKVLERERDSFSHSNLSQSKSISKFIIVFLVISNSAKFELVGHSKNTQDGSDFSLRVDSGKNFTGLESLSETNNSGGFSFHSLVNEFTDKLGSFLDLESVGQSELISLGEILSVEFVSLVDISGSVTHESHFSGNNIEHFESGDEVISDSLHHVHGEYSASVFEVMEVVASFDIQVEHGLDTLEIASLRISSRESQLNIVSQFLDDGCFQLSS